MRLGIVGGIHEDIVSLRTAISLLRARGCSAIACTGDIVGFSAPYFSFGATRDAVACIELVRGECRWVVAGNHDLFAVKRLPTASAFAYSSDWYALPLEERRTRAQDRVWLHDDDAPLSLPAEHTAYLSALPEKIVAELGGVRVLISHYAAPNLAGDGTEFDAIENGIAEHLAEMTASACSVAVFDHDLCGGARLFTMDGCLERPFGRTALPTKPVAIEGPWVADGTVPSGVLIVDFQTWTVEALPLPRSLQPAG
jgi:hypothetical protein